MNALADDRTYPDNKDAATANSIRGIDHFF
jgi:hypothetical protein